MKSLAWVGLCGLGVFGAAGVGCTNAPTGDDSATASGGKSSAGGSASGGKSSVGGKSGASGGRGAQTQTGGMGGEASSNGGSGGSMIEGGAPNFGGSPEFCCLAAATCDPGDSEIESLDDCPKGEKCYRNAICCSEVFCVDKSDVQCAAVPTCMDNEEEVDVCPKSGPCEARTLCGTTIYCVPVEAHCAPKEEPYRDYRADSPAQCETVKFECPSGSEYFSNQCGCGCEQPKECPEVINCFPKEPDPLCESKKCPLSPRLQ
jgi:hypothetical protein